PSSTSPEACVIDDDPIFTTAMPMFMRLRPPALDRPRNAIARPGLRSAPGGSCGFDLRPSIARATRSRDRAYGLRLAAHAASTSGPRSPAERDRATGPTVCAGLLMRLIRVPRT